MSSLSVTRVEAAKGKFVDTTVAWLTETINAFINEEGSCILGLSGGSTPLPVYTELGKVASINWKLVTVFMVDERHVPDDHKDSNLRAVKETLLKPGLIPNENLVFPPVHLPYEECLSAYNSSIKAMLDSSPKHRVSLSILGLGDDGHFASLFPHLPVDAAQKAADPNIFVVGTTTDSFAVHNRISTTYAVLSSAAKSVFFIKGQNKVAVFNEMLSSSEDKSRWPAKPVIEKSPTTLIFEA